MPDINKIYIEEDNHICAVIKIDENIVGLNQFNSLNDTVNAEMKEGVKSFTFDMSDLKSINSSGLGILISCLKNIKNSEGTLKIINANEKIINIFRITKLDNVFEFDKTS
ncbi:MAG: STAS domain-containing protein [Ignavibacteria bacterium]